MTQKQRWNGIFERQVARSHSVIERLCDSEADSSNVLERQQARSSLFIQLVKVKVELCQLEAGNACLTHRRNQRGLTCKYVLA